MGNHFTLTLFRHGITLANERKQYLGWSDAPLNERGRKQAARTAESIETNPEQVIYSSDLIRCRETAEILFPESEIMTMHDFREMHFGKFELETYASLKDKENYISWIYDPFNKGPEAGETFKAFSERVMTGLNKLKGDLKGNDLTIVTHGGVIRLFLTKFVKDSRGYFEWEVPNAAGYQLYWEDIEQFKGGEQCTSLWAVPSMEKVIG